MFRAVFQDETVQDEVILRLRRIYRDNEKFRQCCWCSKYYEGADNNRHPGCVSSAWSKAGATAYQFVKLRGSYACIICGYYHRESKAFAKHLLEHPAADLRLIGYSKHLLECFLFQETNDYWND